MNRSYGTHHPTRQTVRSLRPQNLRLALRADSGLALGAIYPIESGRNIIGRSVEVSVPVDDVKVSRVHAAIDQQNGFHYLVDLGSTNGTYLNGVRVQGSSKISIGDELRVGSAVFKVDLLDHAKNQVGKSWKEPTRAILRPEMFKPAELSGEAPHMTFRPTPLQSAPLGSAPLVSALLESEIEKNQTFWTRLSIQKEVFLARHGKWLAIAAISLLILSAIATTFMP